MKALGQSALALSFVLLVFSILLLRRFTDLSLIYPDADRIFMDGIFIFDFFRALPLTRIYDFAAHYYAQYPALSLGYRMPFFPLVEALFHAVFGLHLWSSRLAILAFALSGMTAWYKLLEGIFDLSTAFWSCLFLATTPFVVQWGWYPMAEIPVLSMMMLTAFAFYRFIEDQNPRNLYVAAVLLGLAVWTKQTAVFMLLWFFFYLLFERQVFHRTKPRKFWIAFSILSIMLIPVAVITFWFPGKNLEQSVGVGKAAAPFYLGHWSKLLFYPSMLLRIHLTFPIFILSFLGFVWSLAKRVRKVTFFVLLVLSTYLFFSYLFARTPRYAIFWIPAFCLFAALPLYYLKHLKKIRLVIFILFSLLIGYQIRQVYAYIPLYATGYREAVQYVLEHTQSRMILFDGWYNGSFIYFMRMLDPEKSIFVLRGDKLLSASSLTPKSHLEIYAHSEKDIQTMLDQYGVEYIVIEAEDRTGIEIHQTFRTFLSQGPFQLVKEIPIESNWKLLKGQTLRVYKYLEAKPRTAQFLQLPVPLVKKVVKVSFS